MSQGNNWRNKGTAVAVCPSPPIHQTMTNMNRLLQTMRLDIILQARNYYYHISLGLVLFLGGTLGYFFTAEQLTYALPVAYLFGLGGATYIFLAALVLFEKQERTLTGLVLTPLRPREYINAKLITLTILGLCESVGILLVSYGWGVNWLWLMVGLVGMGLVYCLLGLVVAVRYDTINEFLMPTLLINIVLQLPFVAVLGWWFTPLFYLLPTYPPLLLLTAAFDPQAATVGQMVYGVVGTTAAITALYIWGQRSFQHHVVERMR